MATLFRKYYKDKVNMLYERLMENKKDVILIKRFLDYHHDMLFNVDPAIIKTTGPLDAIFLFYKKDYEEISYILEKGRISPAEINKYLKLQESYLMVIKELSINVEEINPYLNELYIDMALLERLNRKLPAADRVDLDSLYKEGPKKVLK